MSEEEKKIKRKKIIDEIVKVTKILYDSSIDEEELHKIIKSYVTIEVCENKEIFPKKTNCNEEIEKIVIFIKNEAKKGNIKKKESDELEK